jgi:hypothetical protein
MLSSKPIKIKVAGVNYCPVCEENSLDCTEDICSECRKDGWSFEECSTDRGIEYILQQN